MLWLIKMTRPFFVELDSEKVKLELGEDYEIIKSLHQSLMEELQPTPEQVEDHVRMSDANEGGLFDGLQKIAEEADRKLNRLEELVSNNNLGLESEMRELHKIFTPKQIAKFVIWVDKNPACMQLLEALWPHLTD